MFHERKVEMIEKLIMKVQLPRSQSNCITTSAFEMLTPMITSSLYT